MVFTKCCFSHIYKNIASDYVDRMTIMCHIYTVICLSINMFILILPTAESDAASLA